MEGGIGIALLLILVVVAIGFGIALYVTGGALWAKETSASEDTEGEERPTHKAPTSPELENTHFVGTERKD